MKVDIKKLPKCEVEIEIEVPKEKLDACIEKAVLELGKNVNIEGFRKGKAPRNIIEEKIGKENILAEAAEMAVRESYEKAVLDNGIEPISQPEVEIIKLVQGNPLIFKAKTIILPEIKLPDYKKIAAGKKKNKVNVSEEEIKQAVDWLLKSRAKFSLKNGLAEKGDFVEVEYRSEQIKKIDPKESHKDSFILGEGQFIPGFEDNILGMKSGEEKEFSVTFPKDYFVKELADKKVDFKVKLSLIQKVEVPEMNDEFAKSLGQFDNVESLKNNIKEGINTEKDQAESRKIRQEILNEISEKTEMEIPDILIEKEKGVLMHNFKHDIEDRLNVKFEEYLEKVKKTEKDIFDSFYNEAQKRVKEFLTLREIGKKEKVKVEEDELKREADKLLKRYTDIGQAEKDIDIEGLKNYTKELMTNEKIFMILEGLANKS